MKIFTIEQLDSAIRAVCPDLASHVAESDSDLPTYSVERLEEEKGNITPYFESECNYVPSYYGCGLLSRCCALVVEKGYELQPLLFDAVRLPERVWHPFKSPQEFLAQTKWY